MLHDDSTSETRSSGAADDFTSCLSTRAYTEMYKFQNKLRVIISATIGQSSYMSLHALSIPIGTVKENVVQIETLTREPMPISALNLASLSKEDPRICTSGDQELLNAV